MRFRSVVLLAWFMYALPWHGAQADPPDDKVDLKPQVTPLFQNDYTDKMDTSSYTIASAGCALTAWTMHINHELSKAGLHTKNPDGTQGPVISYTPAQINTIMNDYRYDRTVYKKGSDGKYVIKDGKYVVERVETYNGWGCLIGSDGKPLPGNGNLNVGGLMAAVEKDTRERSYEGKWLKQKSYKSSAIPATGVLLDGGFTSVLDELQAGRTVVVRTRNNAHAVLVTSFHPTAGQPRGVGRYDITDPWRQPDGTSIGWLDHTNYGNRIWSWYTEVWQLGGVHDPYQAPSPVWIDPEDLYDLEINPEMYGPQVFNERGTPELPAAALLLASLFSMALARRLTRRP